VKELVKGADGITLMDGGKLKYKASDAGEEGGMSRALQNLHFADPTEPEVGAMGYLYDMPGGVSVLNDSSWTAKAILSSKRPDLPALFFFGEKSPWTPVNDMQQVAGFFTKPTIVRLPQAAENPFVSDAWVFTKSIEAFFKGAKAPKPVDPDAESEEKDKAKEKSKGKTGTRPTGPRG
jgi:pimeloyl-ACP methyl ester carboxylesterase